MGAHVGRRLTGSERLAHAGRLALAVCAISLFLPALSSAASATAPTVIIRVYDAFGATPDELNRARLAVETVLENADVNLRWRRCRRNSADPCRDRLATNELVIRLMRAPIVDHHISSLALGYSSLLGDQQRGTLATVYPDRVRSLAQRARWHAGDLLGNAIAHELGHLLLGTNSHTDEGLMRPHWTASRIRDSVRVDWEFLDEERTMIRAAVSGRAAGQARLDDDSAPLDRSVDVSLTNH